MLSEKEKMLAGQLYNAGDSELVAMRLHARKQISLFNNEDDRDKRKEIIKNLFGATGKNLLMEQRFVCDYGTNIYVGENFFANYNCTMLDVCEIHIGDNAMFGPNCQLLTPLHPLDAKERISDWMDYYNNDRYQTILRWMSPNEFYHYTVTNQLPTALA